MADMEFFRGIAQVQFPWSKGKACSPTFYRDFTAVNLVFAASYTQVVKQLPSRRLKPLRIAPWRALVILSFFEHRDTDIGPYNEFGVTIPVTVDRRTSVLRGALQEIKRGPQTYVLHLPVTTEIALDLGIEVANYPKFLAEIDFARADGWLTCSLREHDRPIVTATVRDPVTHPAGHSHLDLITLRDQRLLRSEFLLNVRALGQSNRRDDARLELGDHPVAESLRRLKLGRLVRLEVMPNNQAILTGPLESFAV